MTVNNPFFLKDLSIENCAIKLLNETVGTEIIPVDVLKIASFLDILVEFNYEKFADTSDLGLTEFYSQDTAPKIFINANTFGDNYSKIEDATLFRKCRFTIAHELGHCYLPTHKDIAVQKTLQDPGNPHFYSYDRQKECEADEFASILLIPEGTIDKSYINDSNAFFKNANSLSETHQVSMQVAIMRLISLSKDSISVILFIDLNEGKIKWYKATEEFNNYKNGVWVNVGSDVPRQTMAYRLLQSDYRQNGIPNGMDITNWFPEYRGQDQIKFKECSVRFPKYIMTYLEITDTTHYNLHF